MLELLNTFAGWLTPERVENILIAFGGALIGTFGGAYAGARAADSIATRKAHQAKLQSEILESNAAIALAFAVCSRALILKKDYTQGLVGEFLLAKRAILAHHADGQAGLPVGVMGVNVDLQSIETLRAPSNRLEALVLEQLGVRGRPLQLAITIAECHGSLNQLIMDRSALVDRWKNATVSHDELIKKIYGIPLEDGSIDTTYSDNITGIAKRVDDCIWFSKTLAEDIATHSKRLRAALPKRARRALPELTRMYFHEVEQQGLLPKSEIYKSWTTAFVKRVDRTEGRTFAKVSFLARKLGRRLARVFGLRTGFKRSVGE